MQNNEIRSLSPRRHNNVLSLMNRRLLASFSHSRRHARQRCHLIKSEFFLARRRWQRMSPSDLIKARRRKSSDDEFAYLFPFRPRRVQESDGSFFESFTALSWKRENRRMSSIRAAETRAEAMPVDEKESIKEDEIETVNEREQLYMDVLSSIANSVGCQQPGGQVRKQSQFPLSPY